MLHLVRGPIHYDFLLPLDEPTLERLGWLGATGVALDHPGAAFLVVGWGGEEFYTTTGDYTDVSAKAVWKGVTGDASVMRVGLAGPIQADWPVERLSLSDESYSALLAGIVDSFARGAATQAMDVPGFSEWDRFYPAKAAFTSSGPAMSGWGVSCARQVYALAYGRRCLTP